jgi:uncharacterized repeat protein (TIGR01451 family)
VTVVASDDDGNSDSDLDDATVGFSDVLPSIRVSKASYPLMRAVPGGQFTFEVHVTNESAEPVTLSSLVDTVNDPAGQYVDDLNGDGTCSLPQTIDGYGSYECEFTRSRFHAPVVITDVVTAEAEDNEGNTDSEHDGAWIEITGWLDIAVTKTASPTTVDLGEPITFTVRVTNLNPEPVTLDLLQDLLDDEYVDLNGEGTCSVPQTVPMEGFYECTFTVSADECGGRIDTVYAHVTDVAGATGHNTASATVIRCGESTYLPLVMKSW